MSRHPLISFSAIIVYGNATLQALLFALVIPTLSLYVAQRFDANAFQVGSFFVANAVSGIIYAQLMGHWSDRSRDRRRLIALGMSAGALACIVFAFSSSYWISLAAGMTFFSLAFASISQIFAHARDYGDKHFSRKQGVMFNSTVRAFSALAWVGGPALGYFILSLSNFKTLYLIVACLYLAGASMAKFFLPHAEKFTPTEHIELPDNKRTIIIAMIAISISWSCNQTYLIALPLFLKNNLLVDSSWAGWIMGTAAAIEIPVMMFAGWLGTRFPLPPLIRIGALAPMLLYLGVWRSSAVWMLFPLQIFNAMLIGFVAGLGMTWFQDLMPGRAGVASALYWNTASYGNILGAIVIAIFAQAFGYRDVYFVNALLALSATALLFLIRAPRPENASSPQSR